MISKLITGNGFGGAVRYSTKYGKDPDGTLHKLLCVSGVTFDYDNNGNLTINPKKVGWDFRQQTLGYTPDTKNYRPITKPVYHWILSWKEGERKIPPEEMLEVAKEFLRRIGFTNTQYVISAHYDRDNQHLHIVANIVNNEGKRIVTQGLIDKAHEVAAAITKERGYAWAEPARKETVESAHKPHEKVRYIIEPIIFGALRTSLTEDELVSKLKESRINTIIRHAEDGKRGGISFACRYRGVEHTFRGSSVDRELSYGSIQKQLEANRTRVEQAMPKERNQSLRPAAVEVGRFADEKEALAKMPLPDVILVTRENYDSVRLPEGFEPYRSGDNIVVRQQVVPEEGLVVFKEKGKYRILPKKTYDKYQQDKGRRNQERTRGTSKTRRKSKGWNIG